MTEHSTGQQVVVVGVDGSPPSVAGRHLGSVAVHCVTHAACPVVVGS